MLKFHLKYFSVALLLLIIEFLIGFFVHDALIRPYGGDFLVVILLYCIVKSFLNWEVYAAALAVLLFSYAVEILQYLHIVEILGLQNSKIACILIGTSFSWTDMLAYSLGILLVIAIEKLTGAVNYNAAAIATELSE
ncbi:MAG: DUF2809 domain-containing protein [Sphingobacteriaceae bacterium]|nr:MAG: DUF2809 domain-containing protein [Sphingobacteriaceae bacterium]